MYKYAQPNLSNFPKYLYEEREERFQTKKLLERVKNDLDVLFAEGNEASCLKFLKLNTANNRPHHLDTISRGLTKLDKLKSQLEKKEKELSSNIQKLFTKNKLKEWATEQYKYSKSQLQEISHLMEDINTKSEKLLIAKTKLQQIFRGIKNKDKRARKIKENKRKAAKRKTQRLNRTIAELKSKLIDSSKELGDNICITKEMLQMGQLQKLRRDRHKSALTKLLETLNWHRDARKCIQVKLTEWAFEKGGEEEEESEEDNEEEEEDSEEEEDKEERDEREQDKEEEDAEPFYSWT